MKAAEKHDAKSVIPLNIVHRSVIPPAINVIRLATRTETVPTLKLMRKEEDLPKRMTRNQKADPSPGHNPGAGSLHHTPRRRVKTKTQERHQEKAMLILKLLLPPNRTLNTQPKNPPLTKMTRRNLERAATATTEWSLTSIKRLEELQDLLPSLTGVEGLEELQDLLPHFKLKSLTEAQQKIHTTADQKPA